MKNIERIIESQYPPRQTNVAWKDVNENTLKFYVDGEWRALKDDDFRQKQADWNQADDTKEDFIKNKPDIDTAPIEDSNNLVSSGGVFASINDVYDYINEKLTYERACQQYLTIEVIQNETELSWLFPNDFDELLAVTIEYSVDNGLTWNSVTAGVMNEGNIGQFDAGQRVLLRGNGATGFYDVDMDDYAGNFLYANKPCYVYGNAMSLLYGANFVNETSVPECALALLFTDYNGDVTGEWVLSKEGSPIVLPATTLAELCYSYMFAGCTSLVTAPELPATTLDNNCYENMFNGCASLTTAPELPATTLADRCYLQMFYGCTLLASVKCLASAVFPSSAVNNWLYNVSATGTFTKAAGVEWPTGASGIPNGWEVVEV